MKNYKFLHFMKTEMRTQKTTWLIYTLILAVLSAALVSIVALTVQMPDELTEFACDATNLINVSTTDTATVRALEECPVIMDDLNFFNGNIDGFLLQEDDILRIIGREDLIGKLTDGGYYEDIDTDETENAGETEESDDAGETGESDDAGETGEGVGERFSIPTLDTVIMLNIDPDDRMLRELNEAVSDGEPYTKECNHELYLWISRELAEYRGLHTGDVVSIPYNVYSGKKVAVESMDCVIKGIFESDEYEGMFPIQCMMTYEVGRRLQGPVPFRAALRVKSILQYNNVITKLRKAGAMVYFSYDPETTENDSITGYIYILYALFGVNVLVLLMLLSVLIMLVRMYVSKRTRFFAMLRTTGMSGRDCTVLNLILFAVSLTVAFAVGFGLSPLIVMLVNDVFSEQLIDCSLTASPLQLRNLGLYAGLLITTALIVWILTAKNRRSEIVAGLHREL